MCEFSYEFLALVFAFFLCVDILGVLVAVTGLHLADKYQTRKKELARVRKK